MYLNMKYAWINDRLATRTTSTTTITKAKNKKIQKKYNYWMNDEYMNDYDYDDDDDDDICIL